MADLLQEELREELRPEIGKFRRAIHKLIPKILRKPLLLFLFILPYISFLIGLKSEVLNINFDLFKKYTNQSGVQVVGDNNSVVLSEKTQCLSRSCSDFDDDKWVGIGKFIQIQNDPLILKSPNTSQLPGATMYYKEKVGNFISRVFITPQASASANLVLSYGHLFRCIVGDSDYEQISCQINQDHPTVPENWGYFDEKGNIYGKSKRYLKRPFEANTEMEIKFEQRVDSNNTIISIKLNNQVPAEWILPKKYQGKSKIEALGIGLITTNYDDAQAVFKHFELDSKL